MDGGACCAGSSEAIGGKKKKDKAQGNETRYCVFHEVAVHCNMVLKGDQ